MPLSSFASPAFGLALILLGLAFLWRHRRTWQARQTDETLDEGERDFHARQYRRRMLTSGLIVLLGVLIPLGDLLFERNPPAAAALPLTIYWICVLLVVLWVLLLGVMDLFATGIYAKDEMSRVRSEKAALERQLEEIRKSMRDGSP